MAMVQSGPESLPFFQALDNLIANHKIVIDRPRSTAHPRFPTVIYPLDYGYLEGTKSGDGDCIDVWIGSIVGEALLATAAIMTVDMVKLDSEIKVLVNCTAEETQLILDWHNCGGQHGVLVRRPDSVECEAST